MKNYQRIILGFVGGLVVGKVFFGTDFGFSRIVVPGQKLTNNVSGAFFRDEEQDTNFPVGADGFQ